MPTGRCANCDAAISSFARACPQCGASNQPNTVTIIVALGTLIVLGVATFFGVWAFLWSPSVSQNPPEAGPSQPNTGDYDWLVQAMAECDAYAKQNAEVLYFLITPMALSGRTVTAFQPDTMGELGKAAVLVRSTDALIGLRNGAFVISRKPFTFALKDIATGTVYKWRPSVGVTELKSREITATSLSLGIQISDKGDVDWGPTLTVSKGTCYWTNPLFEAGG